MLYDATILCCGLYASAARSGIYVASYEILRSLLSRGDMRIDLYVTPERVQGIQKYLEDHPELADAVISDIPLRNDGAGSTERVLESFARPQSLVPDSVAIRLIWFAYRSVRWLLIRLARMLKQFERGRVHAAFRRRYDVFFSPVYVAPEEIVASGLPRRYVLYDTIPMLFPQFYTHEREEMWTSVLARKLTAEDRCFAISECTKRDFLRFSPNLRAENVDVIPLAAAERFYPCADQARRETVLRKYKLPTDRRYFLSLCTIEPRKNLPFVLRAFAEFAKADRDTVLVLAGGGWPAYHEEWESILMSVSEVRDRVFQPGYIADEDLAPLYSGARAFVYMSLYEGFGLPPLEAMQCGTPVITSNVSSIPEVVGDAAMTVAPDDLVGAVKSMRRMAAEDELCEAFRKKGIDRARRFSWACAAEIIAGTMRPGSR